jgi:hypothetical protein
MGMSSGVSRYCGITVNNERFLQPSSKAMGWQATALRSPRNDKESLNR